PRQVKILAAPFLELADLLYFGPNFLPVESLLDGPAAEAEVVTRALPDFGGSAQVDEIVEPVLPALGQAPLWQFHFGRFAGLDLFGRGVGEVLELAEGVAAAGVALDQFTRQRGLTVPLVFSIHRAGQAQQAGQVLCVVAADLLGDASKDKLHALGTRSDL